jgi:hypothetical protein
MLKCGMSEVIITPELGACIPGYLTERKATGIKDELYAKAMVLSKDNYVLALIAMDILDIERNTVMEIRERVHNLTGIPPENIMVCATHTHTGAAVVNSFVTKADQEYLSFLVRKASDAALIAYNRLKPAKIGCGAGVEKDIAFNRRYFMKDGRVLTNPGIMNPLIDRPAGPTDPEVIVLRIDDFDDNPIGVVTNYTCHLDVVGGTEYCADYAGELSRVLKKALANDMVSIFLTGASGNINHIDVNGNTGKNPEHYKKMGRILAGEVIKVREKINTADELMLYAESITTPIVKRQLSEDDFKAAINIIHTHSQNDNDRIFAKEVLEFQKIEPEFFDVEVQTLKIGDASITGLSGDVFTEFGLEIKEKSLNKYNMISTHTNGRNGYIPTKDAFNQGGYEVRTSRSNKLERDAGYKMVNNALILLSKT